MKTASLGSGARPEPADGPITLAVTGCKTRGFAGTSRFTTSTPELGVINVLAEHAVEPHGQLACHGGDRNGSVFFSGYQTEVEISQFRIGLAVNDAVRGFDQQMAEQPIALFRDVAHARSVTTGKLTRVQAAIGSDTSRAIESRDWLKGVDHGQRGEQPHTRMSPQQADACILVCAQRQLFLDRPDARADLRKKFQ